MMKKLLISKLPLLLLTLASTTAFAHTGHLPVETVHGLLHIEHIITVAAIGVIAYFVNAIYKK